MEAQSGRAAGTTGTYVRLLSALAALGAGVAAVVVVALLVYRLPAVTSSGQSGSAAAVSGAKSEGSNGAVAQGSSAFPTPPPGAVVFARQAGRDVLGLGVVPRRGQTLVQASVVRFDEKRVRESVRFRVSGPGGSHATAGATACGNGCYRATVPVAKPERITVSRSGHKPLTFAMPAAWPPPSGAAIVRRAAKVWLGLNTLVFNDSLGDGKVTLNTVWKVVAPDRLAYRIDTGEQSIIIGDRRWIKPSGAKKWITQQQSPVSQPQPFWSHVRNAHILGSVTARGRPAWKISFFDPDTPGWFTVLVDKETGHTLELWMTATAHFMHDTYRGFDKPLAIVPPG